MKRSSIILFISITLLVVLSFVLFIFINDHNHIKSSNEKPLVFTDKVFERILKKALNKSNKDNIFPSDLDSYVGIVIAADHMFLISPTISEKGIVLYSGKKFVIDSTLYNEEGTMTSLNDLKYFSNLTTLKVYFQKHINYDTINPSSSINNLSLYADDIIDLNFIDKFINLSYLSLNYNKIKDLTPLSQLIKLKTASINNNNISNLAGIEKLTSLTNVQLDNNQITNVSLISLLTNLTYLSLQNNKITDVSPLKSLTNLATLYIKDNPIINIDTLNTLTVIPE